MYFKFCTFAFVALAVQVATGAQFHHQTQDTADDIIKTIAGLLVNATNAATTALGKLDTSLAKIEDNIESDESKVFNKIVQVAIDINEATVAILVGLNDTSDATGQKLIACVEGVKDQANGMINSTITELLTCSTTDAKTIVTDLRTLFQDLSASLTKVGDSATELENCTSGATLCGLTFANSVATIVKDFVATVQTDVDSIVKIIEGLGDKISGCSSTVSDEVNKNNIELFNEVSQCLSA